MNSYVPEVIASRLALHCAQHRTNQSSVVSLALLVYLDTADRDTSPRQPAHRTLAERLGLDEDADLDAVVTSQKKRPHR